MAIKALMVGGYLVAATASAQDASTLTGTVFDAATRTPVTGAEVIASSPVLKDVRVARTDKTGKYRFVRLPAGTYEISLEKNAYQRFNRQDINVRGSALTRVNVDFLPDGWKPEEMIVVARLPTLPGEEENKLGPVVAKADPIPTAVPEATKVVPAVFEAPPAQRLIPPRKISGPDPQYTQAAIDHDVQGLVSVKCVVTVAGKVRDCRILKSLTYMDQPVVKALEGRTYAPATLEGKPVEVEYVFNVRLSLPHGDRGLMGGP